MDEHGRVIRSTTLWLCYALTRLMKWFLGAYSLLTFRYEEMGQVMKNWWKNNYCLMRYVC